MRFYLKNKLGTVDAKGDYVDGKFIVLEGSVLSPLISDKFRGNKTVLKRRSEEGVLKNNILQRNYEFNSPSIAGEFVTGQSCNGRIAWKDESGRTFKEIIENN